MTEQDCESGSEANAGWLEVVGMVLDGRLAPDAAVERLRALAGRCPDDSAWLEEEAAELSWTYALDVEAVVKDPARDYWAKVLTVSEGLLEERVTPGQALDLLEEVATQFPQHANHIQQLCADIVRSPMWQLVDDTIALPGSDE